MRSRRPYIIWLIIALTTLSLSLSCGKDGKKSPTGSSNEIHEYHGITFVTIPGGTFTMGDVEGEGFLDEKPVHTVTVSGFEMSVYEVTNSQYAAYLTEALTSGNTDSTATCLTGDYKGLKYLDFEDSYCQIIYSDSTFKVDSGKENCPVVEVTWYGAKTFAQYFGLDLPTEAEWEYACRGGRQYKYGTNDGMIDISKTNYDGKVGHSVDVGSYSANPLGLYDMSGNVWELCHDWYGPYSADSQTNPVGVQIGTYRVMRGGDWYRHAGHCRSANRDVCVPQPGLSGKNLGFRVVRRPGGVTY